jgi:RNA polymerase sigma factor (TIGR02999 family)
LPGVRGANVDLYYLGLEREEAEFDQGTARELRHTIGTRLWGKAHHIDYNFEFVYQFGTFGNGNISAWTAASDTGYTFESMPWKPRIGFKADITSGDRNPSDQDLETFNPLFPRGAYFSETGLIGPANHIDLHPSLDLNPSDQLKVTLDWAFFWRESASDAIYGNAVNVLVLQPTALVHEAWLKLMGSTNKSFKNRAHFFSAAAEAMRHILIDRVRRKKTRRHGGNMERIVFDEIELVSPLPDEQLLAVNEALDRYAQHYPTQAEVVKLRYFIGMSNEEIAQLLGISVSTVKNYWTFSRAWLFKEIQNA